MDSERRDVVLKVIAVLEQMGRPYLIGGSFASAIYGIARYTNDADLVADIRSEHVRTLFRAFEPDFYASEQSMIRAVDTGRHFNLIHIETQFKVDVFTPKPGGFAAKQLSRRQKRAFSETSDDKAFFASPEDTVLAKLDWYRRGNEVSEQQWRDVQTVLKVQRGTLDLVYMRQWAPELEVADLLEEALSEAESLWQS